MKLAVLGVGLIGGSIGLAARDRDLAEVTGWVRNPDRAEECLKVGAVDHMAATVEEALTAIERAWSQGEGRGAPLVGSSGYPDEWLEAD